MKPIFLTIMATTLLFVSCDRQVNLKILKSTQSPTGNYFAVSTDIVPKAMLTPLREVEAECSRSSVAMKDFLATTQDNKLGYFVVVNNPTLQFELKNNVFKNAIIALDKQCDYHEVHREGAKAFLILSMMDSNSKVDLQCKTLQSLLTDLGRDKFNRYFSSNEAGESLDLFCGDNVEKSKRGKLPGNLLRLATLEFKLAYKRFEDEFASQEKADYLTFHSNRLEYVYLALVLTSLSIENELIQKSERDLTLQDYKNILNTPYSFGVVHYDPAGVLKDIPFIINEVYLKNIFINIFERLEDSNQATAIKNRTAFRAKIEQQKERFSALSSYFNDLIKQLKKGQSPIKNKIFPPYSNQKVIKELLDGADSYLVKYDKSIDQLKDFLIQPIKNEIGKEEEIILATRMKEELSSFQVEKGKNTLEKITVDMAIEQNKLDQILLERENKSIGEYPQGGTCQNASTYLDNLCKKRVSFENAKQNLKEAKSIAEDTQEDQEIIQKMASEEIKLLIQQLNFNIQNYDEFFRKIIYNFADSIDKTMGIGNRNRGNNAPLDQSVKIQLASLLRQSWACVPSYYRKLYENGSIIAFDFEKISVDNIDKIHQAMVVNPRSGRKMTDEGFPFFKWDKWNFTCYTPFLCPQTKATISDANESITNQSQTDNQFSGIFQTVTGIVGTIVSCTNPIAGAAIGLSGKIISSLMSGDVAGVIDAGTKVFNGVGNKSNNAVDGLNSSFKQFSRDVQMFGADSVSGELSQNFEAITKGIDNVYALKKDQLPKIKALFQAEKNDILNLIQSSRNLNRQLSISNIPPVRFWALPGVPADPLVEGVGNCYTYTCIRGNSKVNPNYISDLQKEINDWKEKMNSTISQVIDNAENAEKCASSGTFQTAQCQKVDSSIKDLLEVSLRDSNFSKMSGKLFSGNLKLIITIFQERRETVNKIFDVQINLVSAVVKLMDSQVEINKTKGKILELNASIQSEIETGLTNVEIERIKYEEAKEQNKMKLSFITGSNGLLENNNKKLSELVKISQTLEEKGRNIFTRYMKEGNILKLKNELGEYNTSSGFFGFDKIFYNLFHAKSYLKVANRYIDMAKMSFRLIDPGNYVSDSHIQLITEQYITPNVMDVDYTALKDSVDKQRELATLYSIEKVVKSSSVQNRFIDIDLNNTRMTLDQKYLRPNSWLQKKYICKTPFNVDIVDGSYLRTIFNFFQIELTPYAESIADLYRIPHFKENLARYSLGLGIRPSLVDNYYYTGGVVVIKDSVTGEEIPTRERKYLYDDLHKMDSNYTFDRYINNLGQPPFLYFSLNESTNNYVDQLVLNISSQGGTVEKLTDLYAKGSLWDKIPLNGTWELFYANDHNLNRDYDLFGQDPDYCQHWYVKNDKGDTVILNLRDVIKRITIRPIYLGNY